MMLEGLGSPANELVFKYAFALVIRQHLIKVKEVLYEEVKSKDQTSEANIKRQDLLYSLQFVIDCVIKNILSQQREDNTAVSRDKGNYSATLLDSLGELLMGPKKSYMDIKQRITTKEILDRVDAKDIKGPEVTTNQDVEKMNRAGGKLRILCEKTIKLKEGALKEGAATASEYDIMSIYAGLYLLLYVKETGAATGLPEISKQKINLVIEELTRGQYTEAMTSLSIEKLYEDFKNMLITHLEIFSSDATQFENNIAVVNKLREQGNNLMVQQSYAQSIQIYTTALDMCNVATKHQIPQLLTNRAIAYIGLDCFPESMNDLNQAVDIDVTLTPAWMQLGYCNLYIGASLVALRCYLMTLRTAVGDVLPENKELQSNSLFVEQYQENKLATILPQFVEKIVHSIILTERRAYQQREPLHEIRKIVSNVRAVLAKLRSTASDEDMSYFNYSLNNDDNSVRRMAERFNQTRPDIVNPDVSQNMMANNRAESSGVTMPVSPITSLGRVTRNTDTNGARPPPRSAASSMRGLLNGFGEIFENAGNNANSIRVERGRAPEERGQDNRPTDPSNPQLNQTAGSSSAPDGASNMVNAAGPEGSVGQNVNPASNMGDLPRATATATNNPDTGNFFRDVIRGILPENVAGTVGNMISLSMSGLFEPNQGSIIVGLDNQRPNPGERQTGDNGAGNNNDNNNQQGSGAQADADYVMPEVPDPD